MRDLVERLRAGAERVAKKCMGAETAALISIPASPDNIDVIMVEAADRIATLERELADYATTTADDLRRRAKLNRDLEAERTARLAAEAERDQARAGCAALAGTLNALHSHFWKIASTPDSDGSRAWHRKSYLRDEARHWVNILTHDLATHGERGKALLAVVEAAQQYAENNNPDHAGDTGRAIIKAVAALTREPKEASDGQA